MRENVFLKSTGITVPVICGAMYPCSNPELIAAVSEAGGMGIIQPLSLIYVYGYEFQKGLSYLRRLTQKPIGMNVIVEKNIPLYETRMKTWVDIALKEGIRFFITALGDPSWVIEKVKPYGGIVYHDVTDRKWAERVVKKKIDGLICVNNRAGGHAGELSSEFLFRELSVFGLPLICAGGISTQSDFLSALEVGYQGVQMGTRFIATHQCQAHLDYKNAIIRAEESDIVKTERVTGVPLSVIRTPHVEEVGLTVGPLSRFLFRYRKSRHFLRFLYNLKSVISMKKSNLKGLSTKDYYQAGKSVSGISEIEDAGAIIEKMKAALNTLE